jgi:hypothetical protein
MHCFCDAVLLGRSALQYSCYCAEVTQRSFSALRAMSIHGILQPSNSQPTALLPLPLCLPHALTLSLAGRH